MILDPAPPGTNRAGAGIFYGGSKVVQPPGSCTDYGGGFGGPSANNQPKGNHPSIGLTLKVRPGCVGPYFAFKAAATGNKGTCRCSSDVGEPPQGSTGFITYRLSPAGFNVQLDGNLVSGWVGSQNNVV